MVSARRRVERCVLVGCGGFGGWERGIGGFSFTRPGEFCSTCKSRVCVCYDGPLPLATCDHVFWVQEENKLIHQLLFP